MVDKEQAYITLNNYKKEYVALEKDISRYEEGVKNMQKHKKKLIKQKKTLNYTKFSSLGWCVGFAITCGVLASFDLPAFAVFAGIASGISAIRHVVALAQLKEVCPLTEDINCAIKDIESKLKTLDAQKEFVCENIDNLFDVVHSKQDIEEAELNQLNTIYAVQQDYRNPLNIQRSKAEEVMDMSNEEIDPAKYGHGYKNFPPLDMFDEDDMSDE